MTLKRYFIIGITFILLSTTHSISFTGNNNKKIYSSKYITNYLYGSILYDEFQHNLAVNNLSKNYKLQGQHYDYDVKYVTSLVIEGKFTEAEQYVSSLDEIYSDVFIFNFLKSIFYLKNEEYEKALKQIRKTNNQDRLFIELKKILVFWKKLEKKKKNKKYSCKKI